MAWTRSDTEGERGLGLIELVIATSLMIVFLGMTITPTVSALRRLQGAKLTALAENLGQARIEEIRSLEYEDVGLSGGNPGGVLAGTETRTIQGVAFTLSTEVTYEGSVTGNDVVPQGGDGVEGFWDAGVNYKHVVVGISVASGIGMDPISFETIVSPPSVGAHDGKSNVVVQLQEYDPLDASSATPTWPRVYLQRSGTVVSYSGTPSNEQPFAQIAPTAGTPWVARLGSTATSVSDATTGWRIRQSQLTALTDRVEVGATQTGTITLDLYKPVSLTVDVQDLSGVPLPSVTGSTVTLTKDSTSLVLTETSPEQTSGSTWQITDFSGAPMEPGTYSVTVDIPGYGVETTSVEVDELGDVLTVALAPRVTSTVTYTVYDWSVTAGRQMRGITVQVTGGSVNQTLTTDANGQVSITVDAGVAYTAAFGSPWGHTAISRTDTPAGPTDAYAVIMNAGGANKGRIEFRGRTATSTAVFGWKNSSAAPTWGTIPTNNSGKAFVVLPLASSPNNKYDLRKTCGSTNYGAVSKQTIANGSTFVFNPTAGSC